MVAFNRDRDTAQQGLLGEVACDRERLARDLAEQRAHKERFEAKAERSRLRQQGW